MRTALTTSGPPPIIVWLRDDLRLSDHPALHAANESHGSPGDLLVPRGDPQQGQRGRTGYPIVDVPEPKG